MAPLLPRGSQLHTCFLPFLNTSYRFACRGAKPPADATFICFATYGTTAFALLLPSPHRLSMDILVSRLYSRFVRVYLDIARSSDTGFAGRCPDVLLRAPATDYAKRSCFHARTVPALLITAAVLPSPDDQATKQAKKRHLMRCACGKT